MTVANLATRIISLTGSEATLVYRPPPADDPARRQPDIALAKAELGWEPFVGLDDGLALTVRWFRERTHR
jgi:nucleoside-diphosphate-sugar epimerase